MRKHKKENEEPTSGPGWSAYQAVPEDSDFETWDMNVEHRVHGYPLTKIIWSLISYPFTILKNLILKPKIGNEFEEYEESPEEIRFHELMFEIYDAHKIEFEIFAIHVIDLGKSEIELRNHRITYQKVKLQGNWGVAQYTEKLDGSDWFEYGWFINNGKRNEKIESIKLHLAGTTASLDAME